MTLAANLDQFGHDTWWLVIAKVILIFAFLVIMTLFALGVVRIETLLLTTAPEEGVIGPMFGATFSVVAAMATARAALMSP